MRHLGAKRCDMAQRFGVGSLDDNFNVAAVCGSQVRIYGPVPMWAGARRPLLKVVEFPCYGAAKQFAEEYEEDQRRNR